MGGRHRARGLDQAVHGRAFEAGPAAVPGVRAEALDSRDVGLCGGGRGHRHAFLRSQQIGKAAHCVGLQG
eukprot:7064979-Lingulodinium_polyedra.AAC.1